MLLIVLYLVAFKYEMPVKYSKDTVNVNIQEDEGIHLDVNLPNYKNVNAILVKIDENVYDLYINVTQTLATKIFEDKDKTNNFLRIGNSMIIDFQSSNVHGFIPNGNKNDSIKHIYYIDNLSSKVACMIDSDLINYKNKILIWERN